MKIKELPTYKRNIKVDLGTWNTLKNLKKNNETFNEVIKGLLNQRTISIGNKNIKAIKYNRKTLFTETKYKRENIGVEFEYNDIKNQTNFTLDLKIKKIFYKKQISNPSIFFGLDTSHKHLSLIYLNIYLKCLSLALKKELDILIPMNFDHQFENIIEWRKIYYENSLSEDSFINDLEEPLKSSEQETPTPKQEKLIKKSLAYSIWGEKD